LQDKKKINVLPTQFPGRKPDYTELFSAPCMLCISYLTPSKNSKSLPAFVDIFHFTAKATASQQYVKQLSGSDLTASRDEFSTRSVFNNSVAAL
jgi:hypothetical protein